MGANDKLEATFHNGEPETVGDWAGHTPKPDWEKQADKDLAEYQRANINEGIRSLVTISGENSRDHGFHDDWPQEEDHQSFAFPAELGRHVTQKLMLMAEELLESFGEIRDGRPLDQTYFVDKKGLIGKPGEEYPQQAYGFFTNGQVSAYRFGTPAIDADMGIELTTPLLKPEGFLVEIADLFIRGADLVYLLKLREAFVQALEIKHEYNATRPFKHGRQF